MSYHIGLSVKRIDRRWQFEIDSADAVRDIQSIELNKDAVLRITEALDRRDAELTSDIDRSKRFRFWRTFANSTLQKSQGWNKLVTFVGNTRDEDGLVVAAVFFKGLALFLDANERYRLYDAHLALLYATWQWYNAVKRKISAAVSKGEQVTREDAVDLYEAYQALAALIDHPDFSGAAAWLSYWRGEEPKSRPLLREELRLSMLLSLLDDDGGIGIGGKDTPTPHSQSLGDPFRAPGCMGDDPLDWGKVCLHPAFTSGFGMELVVRRFVQDWLLPRYRFSAAFRLAYLKLNADPAQLPPKPPRALSAVFRLLRLNTDSSTRQSPARALGTATLLFVALTCILFLSEFEWPLSRSPAIEAGILLLPLAYFLLVVLRRFLEPSLLPALALPRVLGGMTLGYAALVIEGTEVATALWNNPLLLVLVWLLVGATTFFYLYLDVLPLVRNSAEARRRSFAIFLFILTIAYFFGILAGGLANLAHCTSNRCPELNGLMLGWTPLWLVVTQMPLAMLIGIVTQFIWEERTATAPVWSPEEA